MTAVLECTDCGRRTFYEKRYCTECGNGEWNEREPGTGELLAVTTVHVSPDGVRKPNRLGVAQFEGQANLTAQVESDLDVGDRIRIDGENALRDGEDGPRVGPRFVPADE